MIIRKNSLLYRTLVLLPLRFSPYWLLPTRIGLDTTSYVQVKPKWHKHYL